MPHLQFLCSVDREIWVNNLIWYLNEKDHIIRNMCTKFQVDWTSTLSKTTLTKNLNLKLDRRTDEQMKTKGQTDKLTDAQTRNIMPLYYCRWGIKNWRVIITLLTPPPFSYLYICIFSCQKYAAIIYEYKNLSFSPFLMPLLYCLEKIKWKRAIIALSIHLVLSILLIKLRMEMGNVPKRQQPDHRKKQQQKVTNRSSMKREIPAHGCLGILGFLWGKRIISLTVKGMIVKQSSLIERKLASC